MNTLTAAQADVAKIIAEVREANRAEGIHTEISATGNVWMGTNTVWYEILDEGNHLLWWVMLGTEKDHYGFYSIFAEDGKERLEKDLAE